MLVDRGDSRDGAVVHHPPALGDSHPEAGVDRFDPALDVVNGLTVITFEGDGEVHVGDWPGEVVPGEQRHDRCLVHVFEMREIDAVLQHVLRVQTLTGPVQPLLRVVVGGGGAVAESGDDVGDLEVGLAAVDVVPDVHRLVDLCDRVCAHPAAAVGPRFIRDADVMAVGVPLPAVERTLD